MGRSKLQNFNDQEEEVYFNSRKHLFEDVLRDEALGWLRSRDGAPEPFSEFLHRVRLVRVRDHSDYPFRAYSEDLADALDVGGEEYPPRGSTQQAGVSILDGL